MIWSEFLKRVQGMDIDPDEIVVRVVYFIEETSDTVAVTTLEEETGIIKGRVGRSNRELKDS